MQGLARTDSYTKFVPEKVLQSDDGAVAAFLRGYIDGDGEAHKTITTSTRSKTLNHQITYLYARLGIQATTGVRIVEGKPQYLVYVTDTKSKQKVKRLLERSHLKTNTQLNDQNIGTHYGIPTHALDQIVKRAYFQLSGSRRRFNQWSKKNILQSEFKTIWQMYFSTTSRNDGTAEETVQKINWFFKQRLEEMGNAFELLTHPTPGNVMDALALLPFRTDEIYSEMGIKKSTFQNYISRGMNDQKAQQIGVVLRGMIQKRVADAQLLQDLKILRTLAEGKIKWERIESKKKVSYDNWVYDLTVPGIHSFIGGEKPLFMHNTQWCFQTAVTVQKPIEEGGLNGNCLYIDSENSFRPERVTAIAEANGMDAQEALKKIFVARAYNADHQMLLAEKAADLVKEKNIKMVIVDSLTAQFRSEFIGRGQLAYRQQRLNKHMRVLQRLAEVSNVAVLVTNQVLERPDIMFGDPTAPVGGNVVAHASKTRLYLRKGKENKRIAKLVDSPSLPDGEA
ncbi:MAG: DNA repair and recombination protein RadA, partial [archaeon]|nr:DNA repair and recombination protein RadA [archaeon]